MPANENGPLEILEWAVIIHAFCTAGRSYHANRSKVSAVRGRDQRTAATKTTLEFRGRSLLGLSRLVGLLLRLVPVDSVARETDIARRGME